MHFRALPGGARALPAFTCGIALRTRAPTATAPSLPLRCPVHSRARQRRFALPPVVPATAAGRQRAVELLGHATQRRAGLDAPELAALIGARPPDRVSAQMWKAGLQRLARNAGPGAGAGAARGSYAALRARVALPKRDRDLGRVFSVLDVARRMLAAGRALPACTAAELQRHTGVAPASEAEVHHVSRALVALQRARRSAERRPPRVPADIAALSAADMLLGNFEHNGAVGAQSAALRDMLGALPRTRNVARSWKKIVAAAARKFLRRERAAARRREVEIKRERRRLKRTLRGAPGERAEQKPAARVAVSIHPVEQLLYALGLAGRQMQMWIRLNMGRDDEDSRPVMEMSASLHSGRRR